MLGYDERLDLVVAADVLYEPQHYDELLATLVEVCGGPGGCSQENVGGKQQAGGRQEGGEHGREGQEQRQEAIRKKQQAGEGHQGAQEVGQEHGLSREQGQQLQQQVMDASLEASSSSAVTAAAAMAGAGEVGKGHGGQVDAQVSGSVAADVEETVQSCEGRLAEVALDSSTTSSSAETRGAAAGPGAEDGPCSNGLGVSGGAQQDVDIAAAAAAPGTDAAAVFAVGEGGNSIRGSSNGRAGADMSTATISSSSSIVSTGSSSSSFSWRHAAHKPTCYICYRVRKYAEHVFETKANKCGFRVERIPLSELHSDYQCGGWQLLKMHMAL